MIRSQGITYIKYLQQFTKYFVKMSSRSNKSPEKKKEFTQRVKLNDDELSELKTAFTLLDRNQDGRVSVSEFQHMLKNFGIEVPDKMVLALMKSVSHTGAGLLTENEFLEWVATLLTEEPDDITQDLVAAFRVFDKDHNGYITKDELKVAMDMIGEEVTEQELNNMIALADTDRDGRIDYEEFAKLLL